jgi:beta-lactam-binding protein with PASTA domain
MGLLVAAGAILLAGASVLVVWALTRPAHRELAATTVVVTTSPRANATTTGATASGAAAAAPDLVGLTLAEAEARLSAQGLRVAITRTTSDRPAGTIVDQAPKAHARVAKGATVTLAVAQAPPVAPTTTSAPAPPPQPQTATMPDVQGSKEAAAVQTLAQAGILASIVFVPAEDTLGTVVSQAKAAGDTLPYHAHVQLNLSRGPNDNPPEQVPSVVGRTLPEGLATLQGAHLRLIYLRFRVTSRARAGKIVQQTPLGGSTAPRNAQVLVYLGAYPATG